MRIAFVTNLAPYYRRPFFQALAAEHEVDFYFFSAGAERYVTPQLLADVRAADLAVDRDYRRWQIAGQGFVPDLLWRLRRDRYDAVIKCLNGKIMTPWVATLARMRDLPLVLWTGMWYHPQTPLHRLTAPLTRKLYCQADAIVTYGEHVKDFLITHEGVSPAKTFVAGQAVDGTVFESAAKERVRAGVLNEAIYVGQLEERKGLLYLLEAFARVDDMDARLKVIGDGTLRREVMQYAAADPRLTFLGHISQDELAGHLGRARFLVLPSITTRSEREPWGLVANEAMHSGIPVIASTAVGAAAGGLVRSGETGLVVPERSAEALSVAFTRLFSAPEYAEQLGVKASSWVRSFTYARMVEGFDAALAFAVADGQSSRSSAHCRAHA